jgi:hypothetical protein
MLYHVVVAMSRLDLSEAIVALCGNHAEARARGRRIAAGLKDRFFRCRVREADLTIAQVKQICVRWGRDDAMNGEPLDHNLPQPFAAAYEEGYLAGKKLARQQGEG